ncbi:N-acetylmuramoyl-L-alanine amidase [Kitasatospora sp. NPDC001175]|uniref:N-acetylmuramoyl-L-alanine amidase n=1 Tax=Kitasatospora sp. NPDC001175 TaxID=3157103 RepID=UPI003CFE0DCE
MHRSPTATSRPLETSPATRRPSLPPGARRSRRSAALVALATTCATACATGFAPPAGAAAPADQLLQRQFAAAAAEFKVPQRLLLALAYQQTRWESHRGQPSTTGNYGPLGLTQVDVAAVNAAAERAQAETRGRGDDRPLPQRSATPAARRLVDSPALHTLDAAAELIHRPAGQLRSDPTQNLRGGAALLARYQRDVGGPHSADPGAWYGAVARFGAGSATGPEGTAAGRVFADRVYRTVRTGASRATSEGARVTLPAAPGLVVTRPPGQPVARAERQTPECPESLGCDFVPAAYALTDPNDPTSYGNYNPANRPDDGQQIRWIVIHDTESNYAGALAAFQDPREQAAAHYLVRASDGQVTQLVRTRDIAWHSGNKTVNMHSVGIEHEGFALPEDRPTWYSEQLYQSSAELVRYLAARFGVPLDRQHIIGHDDVPGPTQADVAGMHWDPGTFWDWGHYLELLRAPIGPGTDAPPKAGDTVIIAPAFDSSNQPPVSGVPNRPENFVYLRTRPAADAPLINGGTTRADDWSDKAVTGTGYVVADQQGDWTAIWYDGQKCWFSNPNGRSARTEPAATDQAEPDATAGRTVLTPRPGLASIPVYGRAYPEAAAYAPYPAIKPLPVVALQATVPAGQAYLAADDTPEPGDYFYDQNINGDAPDDRTLVVGKDTYYPIRYDHRLAFLRSSDVQAVRQCSGGTP